MSSIPQQLPQAPVSYGEVNGTVPAPALAPAYTLFDANAVALATFLGTPVAGATLMLVNDKRLGRAGRGILTLILTVAVTALVVFLGWNIPRGGSSIFAVLMIVGMRLLSGKLQGAAMAEHLQRGGRLGSQWAAAGVGLVFLAVFVGVVFAVVSANQGTKVLVGTKDEVYYSGTATAADATALGNALKGDGYFTDRGVTVALDKEASGPIVSFVIKEGAWEQPDTVATFDEIGRQVAPLVGGFPIKVRLQNKEREVKNESTVGKLSLGNDHIYYLGSATEAQAQALGNALKTAGFFEGKGVDVFLAKQSDGTALSFVVGDGAWDDASMVTDFEKITRDAAPAVGGLPIRMRLENTSLEVKKDEVLK
jgi:hypothetical protein